MFVIFSSQKQYLIIRLEEPNPEKAKKANPYNYLSPDAYFSVAIFDEARMGMSVNLTSSQGWIWNTTIDEIYRAAVQNIRDFRSGKNDGTELVRRLLQQYFQ